MYHFSDSDSKDSEDGIRFKTDSTRFKKEKKRHEPSERLRRRSRSASRRRTSKSPGHRRRRSKSPISRRRSSDRAKRSHRSPPQLKKAAKSDNNLREERKKEDKIEIGPKIPSTAQQTNAETVLGPQLPPHLVQSDNKEEKCIDPTLPPHLRQQLQMKNDEMVEDVDSEEEIYGPLPVDETNVTKAHVALEERALQLKMDQLDPQQTTKPKSREEWMLELPDVKAVAGLGLTNRQFRSKSGPDMSDRSSWTDTPEDKEKKKTIPKDAAVEVDLKKDSELKEIRRRDREQEAMAKKHKKQRKESLVEMHQKKIKKKKDESGPSERRPFNRDVDLQVNRFDEAQKKAVLKKAQLLDERFSRGQSKFL